MRYSKSNGWFDDLKSIFLKKYSKLRTNRLVMGGIAGCLLLLAGLIILATTPTPPDATVEMPSSAYFYDLGAGKLFTGSVNEAGPIDPPSKTFMADGQPAGVRAAVYSCDSCATGSERFIGYLYAWPPSERAKPSALRSESNSVVAAMETTGAAALDVVWFSRDSEEAVAILDNPAKKCGERVPIQCAPTYTRR